jgi:hypothetical protein
VRAKFGSREVVFSKELCQRLNQDDELPYAEWHHGKGIRPADFPRYLGRYGVTSKNVRIEAESSARSDGTAHNSDLIGREVAAPGAAARPRRVCAALAPWPGNRRSRSTGRGYWARPLEAYARHLVGSSSRYGQITLRRPGVGARPCPISPRPVKKVSNRGRPPPVAWR